jgi:hypothetical protein
MITFWLNSEKVRTAAIVRTCDSGMGMGIEFRDLDEATQKQLQRQVETIAIESEAIASLGRRKSRTSGSATSSGTSVINLTAERLYKCTAVQNGNHSPKTSA